MKELDEMEKINAKLSAAVEEVTLEHCKKNEVINLCFFYCYSFIDFDLLKTLINTCGLCDLVLEFVS